MEQTYNLIKLGEYFECKLNKNASLSDWIHVGLDILGFIPGYGDVLDAANAGAYFYEGEYVWAALSMISVIPTIGDLIGKAGKAALWFVEKSLNGATFTAKYGKKAFDVLKNIIKEGLAAFKANKPAILSYIKSIENNSKWIKYKQYFPKVYDAIEKIETSFFATQTALDTFVETSPSK